MEIENRSSCGCGQNNMNMSSCGCGQNNVNMNSCGCNQNDTSMINMNSCGCGQKQTREEMLKQIKCYRFAVIELGLYLDTHVDDEKALCLHRKYAKELRELSDKYQKVYGPLTIEFPCNKWRWLEEPWPWEGGSL